MFSFKYLNLKHLHSFFFAPKQAFTLVELIVVISVLAVLATIAFTQVSNVTQSARNSTRMTNIQSISSSLNIYKATNWTYPIPDNKTDILYSGTTIWYQWYIKDTAARLLKLSPSSSQDPLNTSTYFSYATNNARTNMQLLGFLEANATSFKALPATLASDELATKTPYSKGEELWILYTSWTTTSLVGTSIDLNTTTNPYTAYYNSTDSLSGTWNLLQNLVISYAHGSGFGSSSTDDCPTGFIPVPGNKDFNQPGFCVMKYEAKVAGGVVGTSSGHLYNTGEVVVSNATDVPVNYVSQSQAITACKMLGAEYHLITNSEWMTLSRNIEWVSANWSTNQVGSGYVYAGHNTNTPAKLLTAWILDSDGYYGEINPGAAQKRTLSLSNGQVIWDLAGNVWEHVNKANTINGTNYNVWQNAFASATTQACPWEPSDLRCFELNTATGGNIPLSSILPLGNFSGDQWIGMGYIYGWSVTNIYLRGGGWSFSNERAWVYSIILSWRGDIAGNNVGFRCAK